jgi:hypothetical protein
MAHTTTANLGQGRPYLVRFDADRRHGRRQASDGNTKVLSIEFAWVPLDGELSHV